MSVQGTFSTSIYCRCGATMHGSGSGDLDTATHLANIFWSKHQGDDHGPATPREAANARARQLRADQKRWREESR